MSVGELKDGDLGIPVSPFASDEFLQTKLSPVRKEGGSTSKKKKFHLATTDCTETSEELAQLLIEVIIQPRADLGQEEALGLVEPLTAWLALHGIISQTNLRMTKFFWLHNTIVDNQRPNVKLIVEAVPISYLDSIVELVSVLDYGYFRTKFLGHNTKYITMLDYYKEKNQTTLQEMMHTGNRSYETASRIPTLEIAPYTGDLYSAEELMRNIKSTFEIKGVHNFLTSESECNNKKEWSQSFTASIGASIAGNSQLGYIAQNNTEPNCCLFFKYLKTQIYTTETQIGIMNRAWKTLLSTSTEHEHSFLEFYNIFKTQMQVLIKGKSTIAKDEGFLKMYLHEAIQIDSLKLLSSKLLSDPLIRPLKHLEKMKSEVSASCISNRILNDEPGSINNKKLLRSLKVKIPLKGFFLPRNTDNKVPSEIYRKLREWFKLASVKVKTAESDKAFNDFQWNKGEPKSKGNDSDAGSKATGKRRKTGGYPAIRHTSVQLILDQFVRISR